MDAPYAFPHVPPDTASLLSEKCLERLSNLYEMFSQTLGVSKEVYTRSRANYFSDSLPEINFRTSFIETAQTTLSSCDKLMADIDHLSKHLKSQRDAVDRAICAAQSLSSPVRRIPPEILSAIFDVHCSARPSFQTVSPETATSPTLTLAHTCSFWQATVSRPDYWRSLRIDLEHVTKNEHFTDFLIEIITRSSDCGLLLNIIGLGERTSLELTDQRARVLDTLVRNASRWQTASLVLSDDLLQYLQRSQSSAGQPAHFSVLQALDCSQCSDEFRKNEHHPLNLFHDCPNLERLSTKSLWLYHPLDVSHITHLELDIYFGYSLAELLMGCPRLRSCQLEFQRWLGSDGELSPPFSSNAAVTHDLSELVVHGVFRDPPLRSGAFPSSLYLPNLTSLTLPGPMLKDQLASITQLISRSHCPLESLTLLRCSMEPAIQLLALTPTLLTFKISMQPYENNTQSLLVALTITPAQCIAPKLVSLEITANKWDREEASEQLCEMVESRCPRIHDPEAVHPGLQTLRLTNIDTSILEIHTRLKFCEKSGLVIEWLRNRQDW